jgi:hypothetical protein
MVRDLCSILGRRQINMQRFIYVVAVQDENFGLAFYHTVVTARTEDDAYDPGLRWATTSGELDAQARARSSTTL